jgi:hypothetical protein
MNVEPEVQPKAAPHCFSGSALRAGYRPARGVAQDAPFITAARLKRRAGALTETGGSYYFRLTERNCLKALGPLVFS